MDLRVANVDHINLPPAGVCRVDEDFGARSIASRVKVASPLATEFGREIKLAKWYRLFRIDVKKERTLNPIPVGIRVVEEPLLLRVWEVRDVPIHFHNFVPIHFHNFVSDDAVVLGLVFQNVETISMRRSARKSDNVLRVAPYEVRRHIVRVQNVDIPPIRICRH